MNLFQHWDYVCIYSYIYMYTIHSDKTKKPMTDIVDKPHADNNGGNGGKIVFFQFLKIHTTLISAIIYLL